MLTLKSALFTASVLLASSTILSQSLNVLVIGSTASIDSTYTPYDPTEVVAQLDAILQGDNDFSGTTINVQFNDIFRSDSVGTTPGSSGTSYNLLHKRFSLYTYCNYPADKANNLEDLRGELSHNWDYVIIMGDPYMISNLPGYYALGVNKVLEHINQGNSESYLFMQWPDLKNSTSNDHFEEITYRIGEGAAYDLEVIPAGLAWNSLSSDLKDATSTANHPSPNGAYLAAASIYSSVFSKQASYSSYSYDDQIASHVLQSIQNAKNKKHYEGAFNFSSPFSSCNIITNSIDYLHTGTSTEHRFQAGFIDVLEEEQLYSRNSPYNFNYGRANHYFEQGKRYKTDKNLYPFAFGFPMQEHSASGDSTTFYGIDHRDNHILNSFDNGTDLGVARYMLDVDQMSHLRAIPVRSLTAQLLEVDLLATIYSDDWHLSTSVNRAVGSYMFTLLTGKCGLQDSTASGSHAEPYHKAIKVGYQTAWTNMHLKGKTPGFRVVRTDLNDTTINSSKPTTLDIRFLNQPTDTVRVFISSDNEDAVNYTANELIFTPSNYASEQSISITSLPGDVSNDRANIYFHVASNDIFFNDFYDVWSYEVERELVPLGVVESDFENLLVVYPNPTKGSFSINLGKTTENASVEIIDLHGKLMLSQDFKNLQVLNIDINMPSGVYLVKIRADAEKAIIRLVQESGDS